MAVVQTAELQHDEEVIMTELDSDTEVAVKQVLGFQRQDEEEEED